VRLLAFELLDALQRSRLERSRVTRDRRLDGIAPPATMERRVVALRRLGTVVEYRKYKGVSHGFGLGTGTTAEGWIGDAVRFWERQVK